jgi:hypothetical protein
MGLAKSQQSLKNWTDQKWMTSGTHANKKRGSSKEVKANGKKRYLPEAAWDSLSSGEKAATNKAKAKGNSKGKQFVSQPKGIKEKTKSFRKFGGANNNKSEIMKSMYKKGGKPSKKKVMKEAKKEGESFIVENKELSFGAPQMRKGGMKKYENGGPIVTKGLFRDSVSTKVGDDSNYSYNTTVTDKKGRTRKVIEGNYMSDSTGDLDSGTVSKYNRRGELKSSKPYGEMYSNERSGPVEKKGTTQSSMKKKKGGLKKYEDGGSTTRKNILGQTIKETYSESGAPSFDENNRLGSSKYTKEVYRRDGSLAKVRESDSAHRLFGYDNVSKVTKYDREGNVKSSKGFSGKDIGYKKGGVKKYEDGGPGKGKKFQDMTAEEKAAYVKADMKSRAERIREDAKRPGPPTADSTDYFNRDKELFYDLAATNAKFGNKNVADVYMKKASKAASDSFRQQLKGKTGFDKNGYPIKRTGGAKSMEPGGGGRFAKMVSGLKKEGKSEDSAKAIAASIGRKKYGKSKFQAMAAAGKKRMGGKKC